MQNAVILGSFDGVHLGHKAVIDAAKGYNRIAVTFALPPKLSTDEPQLIMTLKEKTETLKLYGVSVVEALEFEKVKNISACDFLEYLKTSFSPELIVCGFNYRFGKSALGDTNLIKSFCQKNNIKFMIVPKVERAGVIVSSSYIRSLISSGHIKKANSLLNRCFGFCATVVKGDKRGREIGFPTINQNYPKELIRAKFGVYSSEVIIENVTYNAITNVGIRPTFPCDHIICETYIPNFSGNLYDMNIRLNLKDYLREEKKFSSLQELKNTLKDDILSITKE